MNPSFSLFNFNPLTPVLLDQKILLEKRGFEW